MVFGKSLEDHLDDFNKLILDLKNIEIKIDDEEQALLLLRSLLGEFENLSDSLIDSRDSLSLDEVQAALFSKELKKKSKGREDSIVEGLNIRGRPKKRDFKNKKGSRSKSRDMRQCFYCHEEDHLKRDCLERKKRFNEKSKENGDADVASDGYESANVLCI